MSRVLDHNSGSGVTTPLESVTIPEKQSIKELCPSEFARQTEEREGWQERLSGRSRLGSSGMTPVISGDLRRRNELLEFRPQTRRRRSNSGQTVKQLSCLAPFRPTLERRGDILAIGPHRKQELRRVRSP